MFKDIRDGLAIFECLHQKIDYESLVNFLFFYQQLTYLAQEDSDFEDIMTEVGSIDLITHTC